MILIAIALLAAPASASKDKLALIISGGASLGNYEAGLTWGLVRYLRVARERTELAAVTGASAGAINALLAATMWCEDPAETRDDYPDANLFHDTWTPVGLEELLPDEPSAFTPLDGLLRAAPLEHALQRIRTQLFERSGRRFRPGCAVSIGLTVTRDRPEERQVSGLRARTQRFVIPLRLEVDAAGQARLDTAPLPSDRESAAAQLLLGQPAGTSGIGPLQASQAVLASGAFPFAFRPRELCDCALSCPDEDVARDGTCEGPDFGHRIGALSCSSVPPSGSRQLCRRRYIDGGIFDNAPIGLAVDLAESSGPRPPPLTPITYIVVDPDHRRLAPEAVRPASSGLAAPVELIGTLIGTARETELARAIRDERWERTTQNILADAAQLQREAAAIQEEMARIAGAAGDPPRPPNDELFGSPRRERVGTFLLRCLGELRRAAERTDDPGKVQLGHCAEPLRDGSAGAGERRASRLSPGQIVELAEALAAVFVASSRRAEEVLSELSAAATPLDRQLRLLAVVRDVSTIAVTSFRFLVGEIPRISESDLTDAELLRVRRDLLGYVRGGERLVRATSAMLHVLLSATLLEEGQGALSATAARAREALVGGGDPRMESAPLRSMASGSERIAGLIALAPRLRALSATAASIATSAAQLSASHAAERRLTLSRRFSPLGGAELFNFSGFLDRGLRDLDFYLGVYDAVVQIATYECQTQGPYAVAGRPAPSFRGDTPVELDLSARETQRCIGGSLRTAFEKLRLRSSARAAFVVTRLARLELAANLGNRSAAEQLLQEPSWAWLGDAQLTADDPLAGAFAAVTSRTSPCHMGQAEPLCLAAPSFGELLDALQASGYRARGASMREALADRDRWTARVTANLIDRAAAVELHSAQRLRRAPPDAFLVGVGLGQLWSRRAQSLSVRGIDYDPSTIPAKRLPGSSRALLLAAHLLPYRVSLDVVRGGIAFSWLEPALRLAPSFSIQSIADALNIDDSGRVVSTIGLMPTIRLGDVALGTGAQWNIPWNGDPVLAPGAIARVALLQERLALTGGVRSVASGKRESFVTLSVSDFNGLVYWLTVWRAAPK